MGDFDEYEFSEPVQDFLDWYGGFKAESTFANRRGDIQQFERWVNEKGPKDLTNVTGVVVEDYLSHLIGHNKDYAPGTIREKYMSINELFKRMDKKGYVENNPVEDVVWDQYKGYFEGSKMEEATRGDPPSASPEEKEKLVEHAPTPKLRSRLLLRILWDTAVRKHEAAKIRLEDIDRERQLIKIGSNKDETYKNRVVQWQRKTDDLLTQWLDYGGRASFPEASDSDHLLVGDRSEKIKKIGTIVVDAADNAGVQKSMYEDANGNDRNKIAPHSLRRGSARQALANGMDMESLRKYLGHKNLEVTQRYVRKPDEQFLEDVSKYGPGTEAVETE